MSAADISLRDYIAVHVDIGVVDNITIDMGVQLIGQPYPRPSESGWLACLTWTADVRSALRYIEADAMLRARKPRPEPIPVGEAQESDFGGLGLGGIEP